MMEIGNRMHDIIKLRCNACQDFLSLVIKDNWREKLYKKAEQEVKGGKKEKYISAYNKMRDIGYENYSISEMDVTFIAELFYADEKIVKVQRQTKNAMSRLTEDRNVTNHSSENEEPEELYLRGLLALCDIKNFIKTVDVYEVDIDDTERVNYRRKYISQIDSMMELLDSERIELIQEEKSLDKEIQTIMASKNPADSWVRHLKKYLDIVSEEHDFDIYNKFVIKASDAGILWAHGDAASAYIFQKDFDAAISMIIRNVNAFEKLSNMEVHENLKLIDDLILHEVELPKEILDIIERFKKEGFNITINEAGFYLLEKKNKK